MPLPTWTPELDALDLFLSVAETGSVSKAAVLHGIRQPSASTRLHRLERQVGVALLVRSSTGSTLTPAGEAFASWAGQVVEASRRLVDGVLTLRGPREARLRVAASLTIAEYLLPGWLLPLQRRHPRLSLAATVENSRDVCELVRTGAVEVGFVEMPEVPAEFSARPIGTDRLVLVAAPQFPAAHPGRAALTAPDLVELPLLLREPGSGTRDTFLYALSGALGGPVTEDRLHATQLGSTSTILAGARAGGGIGVVSARAAASELATGSLVTLRTEGLSLERRLHAIWLGRSPSTLAGELIELAAAALAG